MPRGVIAAIVILAVLFVFNAVYGQSLFKGQPAPKASTGAAVSGAPGSGVHG